MSTVYALVAGIDAYRAVSPLAGARNDAVAAAAFLRSRAGDRLRLSELYDGKATRDAIIDGLRHHLGQAGPGDTAVFWFAGHGSASPVPPELWRLEPSGSMQSLVCADSRLDDVPDLYDKELSILLDRIAAAGCHLAVVIDACHAQGTVRGEIPEPSAASRRALPAARVPDVRELIPELASGWDALPARSRYVLLAACRSDQLAQELPMAGGDHRGIFSWSLLRALAQAGPRATYRELLAAARCAVEDKVRYQNPQLAGDEPADQPFLGGALRRPAATITLRHLDGRWEIDAGACHGMPPAEPGPLRVAVAGDGPHRPALVTSVLVDRAIVVPEGWAPDPARQYPVIVSELPQPPLTVAVDGPAGFAREADASPFLRVLEPDSPLVPDLRLLSTAPGRARILGADDASAPNPGGAASPSSGVGGGVSPISGVGGDVSSVVEIVAEDDDRCARRTARAAQHIARWRQVRSLTSPGSPLAGRLRLEMVAARPGERFVPADRPALAPDGDGLIRLAYTRSGGTWVPPTVFVRLRNTADRPLYCVLLDLTGSYRVHAALFPGDFIGAGLSGAALGGRPVQFSLPSGTTPFPGTQVRDWLKVIASEEEFSGRPFEQESLGEAGRRGVPAPVTMTRDAGAAGAPDVYDWTAVTLGVITVVPG